MSDYISVSLWPRNSLFLLLFVVWSGFGSHTAGATELRDAVQLQTANPWEQPIASQK